MLSILAILKKKKRRSPEIVVSEAVVLSFQETGSYINGQSQLKLQLQVLPANGRNFVAEIVAVVAKETISAGTRIRVSFNPENHREVNLVSAA